MAVRKAASQTALPKPFSNGFPICQDRGLHGAKGEVKSPRQKCPANSYDIKTDLTGGSESGEVQKERYPEFDQYDDERK